MKPNSKILISGAGVAGLSCANWLGQHGFKPVVVEKSPSIRADGYIISLSHASYHYADRLGVLEAIKAKNSGIERSSYHNARGRTMLQLDYARLFEGIDVVQTMRDDLQTVLFEASREFIDLRLDTSIASLAQDSEGVDVSFSDGSKDRFDIVIGADGLHSNTRRLAFDESDIKRHYLGLFSSAYRLPNTLGLTAKFENHMEQTRYMCVYTTRNDDLACVFIWREGGKLAPSPDERRELLATRYAGAPNLVQQVLQEFPREQTVYMDPLIQIEMSQWHRGRVVLLGDAAHCLTLLSGQGASSAFWGACALAEALVKEPYAEAFAHYEQTLRPVIGEIQPATRLAARWYVPRTAWRYLMRDAAMTYLPNAFYQRYFKRKYSKA